MVILKNYLKTREIAITFLSMGVSAFASAEVHGAEHTASIGDLIPYWVNFCIFVGLLTYLLKKPVVSAWFARRERLVIALEKGEREKREASEKLKIAESKLRNLESEKRELVSRMRREADAEVESVLQEANQKVKDIAALGRQAQAGEEKALTIRLKQELAALVVEKTKKIIEEKLTPEIDLKLRGKAVGSIEKIIH